MRDDGGEEVRAEVFGLDVGEGGGEVVDINNAGVVEVGVEGGGLWWWW